MRILYDHQVFSLQDAGGASRYHYEIARHLCVGPDVRIDLHLGLNKSTFPITSLKDLGVCVVSWHAGPNPGVLRYALNEFITSAYAGAGRKWDIYHPTLYRTMPAVRSKKVVVTHHDCTHERFPQLFRDAQRICRMKARLFRAADVVICVSESSRRDLLHFYSVDERKVRVVYHGLTRFAREPERAEKLISIAHRPYILYVGSRYSYKNFNGLLEAYAQSKIYRDFDLVCVGGGELTAQERARASALRVINRVLVLPVADDAVLAEAYVRAHLFVYPSLYEGFGFPPLEAMSAGCPVLAADDSSIPEICQDAALYFDPKLSGSLAFALLGAIDASDRDQKISRGIALASTYQWSKCAARTLEVYRE